LSERLRRGESNSPEKNRIIMSNALKVVVAGPKGTGKTIISDFLANQTQELGGATTESTAGVRILEFEQTLGGSRSVNIELWDSAGDNSFESCWKAIMTDADAVVLVYNPDAPSHDQQLGDWFEYFVKKNGLKDEQCMIFAHRGAGNTSDKFKPHPLFNRVTAALTTNASGKDIKEMFDNFIRDVNTIKSRK